MSQCRAQRAASSATPGRPSAPQDSGSAHLPPRKQGGGAARGSARSKLVFANGVLLLMQTVHRSTPPAAAPSYTHRQHQPRCVWPQCSAATAEPGPSGAGAVRRVPPFLGRAPCPQTYPTGDALKPSALTPFRPPPPPGGVYSQCGTPRCRCSRLRGLGAPRRTVHLPRRAQLRLGPGCDHQSPLKRCDMRDARRQPQAPAARAAGARGTGDAYASMGAHCAAGGWRRAIRGAGPRAGRTSQPDGARPRRHAAQHALSPMHRGIRRVVFYCRFIAPWTRQHREQTGAPQP